MKKFIKENWFRISIVVILIVGGVYYFNTLPHKQDAGENINNDIAMQKNCADRAALFYKQGGYGDSSQAWTNSYINHWNNKLGKCFIQITGLSMTDSGFSFIDIFDAFEGKHYAMYIGHNICNVTITNDPKRCQIDGGSIWFDGNDAKQPADYHVGFEGLANGPGVGDENTQKQFLEHVWPFMND